MKKPWNNAEYKILKDTYFMQSAEVKDREQAFFMGVGAGLQLAAERAKGKGLPTVEVVAFGPNLRDQSKGQIHIHLVGCKDCWNYGPLGKLGGDPDRFSALSRGHVVRRFYADQIAEGSSYEACASDVWFAPCLKGALK
jgi:hypothetical protein